MDSIDVQDVKERLQKWQESPPKVVQALLGQFIENIVTKQQLEKSNIIKILKEIIRADNESGIEGSIFYSKESLAKTIQLAKEVLDLCEYIIGSNRPGKQKQIIRDQFIEPQIQFKDLMQNMFDEWKDTIGKYVELKPYLNIISRCIQQNLEYSKQYQFSPLQDQLIKNITQSLVRELYYKYEQEINRVKKFQNDIKTLAQFIKRDKNSLLIQRLLAGEFPAKQAICLKSQDWATKEMKDEHTRFIQNQLETENTKYSELLYNRMSKDEVEKDIKNQSEVKDTT